VTVCDFVISGLGGRSRSRVVRVWSKIRMLGDVHVLLVLRLLLHGHRKIDQKLRVSTDNSQITLSVSERAKKVYVGGLLVYSSGMLLMAVTKHKIGVILFSWTAGVMYSTLFTMPYLLVAHYHACGTVNLHCWCLWCYSLYSLRSAKEKDGWVDRSEGWEPTLP
jgi:hypothetical protein